MLRQGNFTTRVIERRPPHSKGYNIGRVTYPDGTFEDFYSPVLESLHDLMTNHVRNVIRDERKLSRRSIDEPSDEPIDEPMDTPPPRNGQPPSP